MKNLNIYKTGFLLALILILSSCSSSQIKVPERETILVWMRENNVPTVGICIIEKSEIKQADVLGEIKYHSPAPDNTLFNIASLTKPLLSTLTLKLVNSGLWDLDEPLYHYWTDPDVINDPRNEKLTTRHVLSHQSGLPNWRGHEPGGKLSFAFEPGTAWKYSGEGYEYLRQALEHKFRIPMEKLVDSLIFNPIGMPDSRYYWDENMDTTLYADRFRADGSPFDPERWYSANASNLVLTTVKDYGKFGADVIKGMGIGKELQEEMIKAQAKLRNNKEFGLGWVIIKDLSNGEYALVHTGSNPGMNTVIILLPLSGRGIVVFTNSENGKKVYEKIITEALDTGREILDRMK